MASKKTVKTFSENSIKQLENGNEATKSFAQVPYSYQHVHNEWIKRAMTSIIDVSNGMISNRSKSILLHDALDCLHLLDKAFEDTDGLSKITFTINENNKKG